MLLRSPLLLALLGFPACAERSSPAQHEAGPLPEGEPGADAARSDAASERDASDGHDALADGAQADADAGAADAAGHDASLPDAALGASAPDAVPPAHTFVYVASYADSHAFRVYEIARDTLALHEVTRDVDAGASPSYICPSKDGRFLYVANETDDTGAGVTVLKVNGATGIPAPLHHQAAIDKGLVFTALDPAGKYLLAASYNGGNVAVYPVRSDGALDGYIDSEVFGSDAQTHSVRVHPSGKWAFVPNKGLDNVAQFLFDGQSGKLSPSSHPVFDSYEGPRHIAFSPDGRFAFLMHELADELSSLAVQADGTLQQLDHKPRLPAGTPAGSDKGAHVLAHPSARYVYGSNRGTNTIAVFAYDEQGSLSLLEHESTRGATPRNFDIDPYGQFLVVANQEGAQGGSLAVFAIGGDGKLTPRGDPIAVPSANAVAIVGF